MPKEEAVEQMELALDLIGKGLGRIIMVLMYRKPITQCTKMDRLTQTAKIINKIPIFTVGLPRAILVVRIMKSSRMVAKSIILHGKITPV
jgi:hypothetical protein